MDTTQNERFLRFWWEIRSKQYLQITNLIIANGLNMPKVAHTTNGMEIYGLQ